MEKESYSSLRVKKEEKGFRVDATIKAETESIEVLASNATFIVDAIMTILQENHFINLDGALFNLTVDKVPQRD